MNGFLGKLKSRLNLQKEVSPNINLINAIRSGQLTECEHDSYNIPESEKSYISYEAVSMEEEYIKKGRKTGDFQVYLNKANSTDNCRIGESRFEYHSSLSRYEPGVGYLTVTNNRIDFDGSRESFNFKFKDLESFEVLKDSLLVKSNNGETKLIVIKDDSFDPDVLDAILRQVVNCDIK